MERSKHPYITFGKILIPAKIRERSRILAFLYFHFSNTYLGVQCHKKGEALFNKLCQCRRVFNKDHHH
jgi:hypothetical protein